MAMGQFGEQVNHGATNSGLRIIVPANKALLPRVAQGNCTLVIPNREEVVLCGRASLSLPD